MGATGLGFVIIDDNPESEERIMYGRNAYFSVLFGMAYIKIIGLNDFMPNEEQKIIVLHELAHYFQVSEDRLPEGVLERELDADIWALETMCNRYQTRNAPELYRRAFTRLRPGNWVTYGGLTIDQRIDWATASAPSCLPRERSGATGVLGP